MADDKEVLIIDNFGDDLELELNSDSPYNTTTASLQPGSKTDARKVFGRSGPVPGGEGKFKRKLDLFFGNRQVRSNICTISSPSYGDGCAAEGLGEHPGPRPGLRTCYSSSELKTKVLKWTKWCKKSWLMHWRLAISSGLTMISSSACLISFPLHLEAVTGNKESDGFSACFAVATILVILFLLSSLGLKSIYWATSVGGKKGLGGGGGTGGRRGNKQGRRRSQSIYTEEVQILKPIISWKNIAKIGFSVGLSVLSVCSAWEDNKVLCNYQDPFLGLVIIFAIVTHVVSRWRHVGFKRAFAMLSIAAGVFVSVDYMLVDHQRCRGQHFTQLPKDMWSWKVHLVWTLAFTVAIWLWTVAMFCLESAIPSPGLKPRVNPEDTSAVKMRVLSVKPNDGQSVLMPSQDQAVIQSPVHIMEADPEANRPTGSRRRDIHLNSPYSLVSYSVVFNSVFWFHVSAWVFITSFFWTEFIPGFGIADRGSASDFLSILIASFYECFHDGWSWLLIIGLFVFSQSFTYLVLLIRNSLLAICIACIGFPVVGVWWSLFKTDFNGFVWMPVYSGELFCAILGLPLIVSGTVYLLKLDVMNRISVSTT